MTANLKKINYANNRDEVISVLEEAGIALNAPIGVLMREARKSNNSDHLRLLFLAKQKIESFVR